MSLSYILQEVCDQCGFNVVNDRVSLLRLVNRACKEIYESTDLPGSLKEITVQVLADSQVALPYYVGELRNARSYYTLQRVTLREMYPKYNFNPWPERYNKWRIVGKGAIQTCVQNASLPIVVTMGDVDTVAVEVTITGATALASRVSETLTLAIGETYTTTTLEFTEIYSITKNVVNNRDITLTGVDSSGNDLILAIIPNDRLESSYQIVDVSALPFVGDMGTSYRYVDILYKDQLPQLSDDGDDFICQGFDDAIVAKCCEFFWSPRENGTEKAVGYGIKCNQIINTRMSHTNGETDKELLFGPNPYVGLFPKYNSWPMRR